MKRCPSSLADGVAVIHAGRPPDRRRVDPGSDFYARLGWRETGRWPGKLRLAPDDTRAEILMVLTPL
jgi:hypothetical protein